MAAAFFCCELGAGIFMVSMYLGFMPGMAIGLIFAGIGKPYFHLAHMGVPLKSWRAILRPDRSWISRGLISIIVFSGSAFLHILMTAFGNPDSTLASLIQALAIVAALVVMTYHGFAIADSTSISFWNTGLMPVTSLIYSALAGVMVALNLAPAAAQSGVGVLPAGHDAALILVVVAAVALAAMLNGANRGSPGARKSLHLLIKNGPYVKWFWGAVVAAGLVLPFLLLSLLEPNRALYLLAALGVLGGYFAFRVLVFKVGLYDPIISFAKQV